MSDRRLPKRMSDRMSEYMSERMSDRIPERMSDRMLEYMLERVSECQNGYAIYIYIYNSKIFQIVCRKPCQNSVSGWGFFEVVFFFLRVKPPIRKTCFFSSWDSQKEMLISKKIILVNFFD